MKLRGIALVGALGAVAACGAHAAPPAAPRGADAPRNAILADFCAVARQQPDDSQLPDFVRQMIAVGTPAAIPPQARRGFELFADHAVALSGADDPDAAEHAAIGSAGSWRIDQYLGHAMRVCHIRP